MLGLVHQLVPVPDTMKVKQVFTSGSRMDDKTIFVAFFNAQVRVPVDGREGVATLVSIKPEYYRSPGYYVVTREVALSVLDKCRMPRGTAFDAKNMYELSITLSIDVSKPGLL